MKTGEVLNLCGVGLLIAGGIGWTVYGTSPHIKTALDVASGATLLTVPSSVEHARVLAVAAVDPAGNSIVLQADAKGRVFCAPTEGRN